MKKIIFVLMVVGVLPLFTSCVSPGRPMPPRERPAEKDLVNERIDTQQRLINQGIGSGELVRVEADMLQGNLNRIRNQYAGMKADSVFSPVERERLNRLLDQNGEMIRNKRLNPIRPL